jgi:hypothetical protein
MLQSGGGHAGLGVYRIALLPIAEEELLGPAITMTAVRGRP